MTAENCTELHANVCNEDYFNCANLKVENHALRLDYEMLFKVMEYIYSKIVAIQEKP